MRCLLFIATVLLIAPPGASADPTDLVLFDPDRDSARGVPAEKAWSLKLRTDQPLSERDARGLVALARPCSGWAHPLRLRKPEAAQRLFEQCVGNAMAKGYKGIALLPGEPPASAPAAAGPPLDGDQLEAVMQAELYCVGWMVRSFYVREQDQMRAELNSFHVARHKVAMARRCLKERLARLGLKQGYAEYRYRPSDTRPKNH